MQESKLQKIPSKKLGFRYSKSLIFPYNSKQQKFFEESQNPSNNNSNSLAKNKENTSNKKRLLMVQKIDIKDQKNSFYKEGISDIFNDENLFFSDKYKDKKIIVGKNQSNISNKSKFEVNFIIKKNLGNFNKKRFLKSFSIKNKVSSSFKKRNNNILIEPNMMNVDSENNNSNYSIGSINSRYESFGKSFNMYGKRSSFFFGRKNYISDGELKIIYKNFLDLEKENKKKGIKSIKLNEKKNNSNKTQIIKDINNKIYKKLFKHKNNSNIDKVINSRLNLQEKILNKFQVTNRQNQNIIDKIIKNTSKDSNDILLMNQLDDYRIKMEKIDEEQKLKKDNNYNKTLYWLSSLRNYPKNREENIINNNSNNNTSNNNNDTIFPTIHRNKRKINQQKEDILDNYINNFHYSFGSNSNLYCDIESNISPLYAFILSDTLKSHEKIRKSHINNYYNSKIMLKDNLKKLKKNLSVPYLKKSIKINNNNNSQEMIKNLNVEGKRLIDCEMEISKKLEGPKKLIKLNYNDDETDTKYLAKSYLYDKYHFPKVVNNAFELHSNQDI